MAITKEQAVNENNREFHSDTRNGIHIAKCDRWRRNGKTQAWKTRPDEFKIPVKFGLYGYGYITELTASCFHLASECEKQ